MTQAEAKKIEYEQRNNPLISYVAVQPNPEHDPEYWDISTMTYPDFNIYED